MRSLVLIGRFLLLCLLTVVINAYAQTLAPLPDVTAVVQQAILQQRFAESKERDYVFREDTNDIRLREECTWASQCPAPFGFPGVKGVGFVVIGYKEYHFEVFWLDGVRVARVLPPCDHCGRGSGASESFISKIPISDRELAAENQRIDSEVAVAQALRARGQDASSPDDPPQILLSRMLELCTFSNPRRETVNGRSTILLDFAGSPHVKPLNPKEAIVSSISGTVGVDEEEHGVQHVEGRFTADVKLDGENIEILKGTRFTLTNRQVDTGIWLLSRLDVRGKARYFAFTIDGDGHIFTGDYRKFHVTSTILPASTEVPTPSPAPKPAQAPSAAH